MKKPSFNDIVTVGGFLITVGGIVFAAGKLNSDVNNLKDTVNATHHETLQTLKDHEVKIDALTTSVARIQGAMDNTVRTRPGTNGGN